MAASVGLGGIAAIVAAGSFAVLVVFAVLTLRPVKGLVQATTSLVETTEERLRTLLDEAATTTSTARGDLDTLDEALHSVRDIAGSAARVAGLLERLVAWPLEKLLAVAGFFGRIVKRVRRRLHR